MDKVLLENTEHFQIVSEHTNYLYDIKVSIPNVEPPKEGFPVYYVLDGNWYFQLARDVVKLQSKNPFKTRISPSIVVGIGHAGKEEDARKRRFFDFTPKAEAYIYPKRLKGKDLGEHGGSEKFLAFLKDELMPNVHKHYPFNQQNQALFGHSLSGLFVLWTLFKQPALFSCYLPISPSVWWNEYELYKEAENFVRLQTNLQHKKLFISVGSKEGFMCEDAKHLYRVLHESIETEIFIAQDENHASVVPTVLSRAFRYLH
ncbi:alpha/beta hydrolase-fold protein [Psychrobacillus sp. MER TA 171]|uniref:alpha/beta hydrolase n=1 Tax=Psychrobacillus sp. MER TA 171 TaxID=2939577 RepID=UPI0020407936|nr:alpha/beta hydrolase-fold protein [Psychrobacillus sp. MER TA 171]MCM3359477.1 alpha/beta hydrolase-fold protein [Psychrobacillus sp. MER TA 171]